MKYKIRATVRISAIVLSWDGGLLATRHIFLALLIVLAALAILFIMMEKKPHLLYDIRAGQILLERKAA